MRWRKVAGFVLAATGVVLLGVSTWGWIWLAIVWVRGKELPPLEEIGYFALGTVLLLLVAGMLYWLGKRLEG